MTDDQIVAVCPQCGSAAAVHSIAELAALARAQLGEQRPAATGPQPGYAAEPQAGPLPGYTAEPQAGPLPGYTAGPRSGPLPGPGARPGPGSPRPGSRPGFPFGPGSGSRSVEDDVAEIALGAAARFIGRAISRRVEQTLTGKVVPAMAARQEDLLRTQIAIAGKYPGLRACLTDEVIFLAGGSRVESMAGMTGTRLTMEQADALVARLQQG